MIIYRTKWAAYILLSSLTVCFNIPPALLNVELQKLHLPCDESVWASQTPGIWLKGIASGHQLHLQLHQGLQILLSATPPPGNVSVFGTYVLLHALLEHIWTSRQNIWLEPGQLATCLEKARIALGKWHATWQANVESSVSPRNPYSAVTANQAALPRLAYTWLGADFSPVRSSIASYDPTVIAHAFMQVCIPIDHTDTVLDIARHAVGALKTRVKLGMAMREQRLRCFQSLEVHLFSIETCAYAPPYKPNR